MKKWNVDTIKAKLDKIYCGGKIPQCVVDPFLSIVAGSEDNSVVVDWKGLDEQILDHRIGIGDLRLFIAALAQCGDDAYVYLDENRLIMEGPDSRATSRLVLTHPDNITTAVSEGHVDQIDYEFSPHKKQEIPGEALDSVRTMQRMIGSETLKLEVGPDGSTFHIGSGTENIGTVDVPELTDDTEYTLNLPAETMKNVLGVLYLDTPVDIRLSGPQSIVEFAQGSLRHIINPVMEER